MGNQIGRNDPCPCGSGKKYKKCCLDLDNAADRKHISTSSPREMTLFVETENGLLMRRLPDAAALPQNRVQGIAAEEATQTAAELWGLPDFIFEASVRQVGSGSREVGDRVIVVGSLGISVQVKSREAGTLDVSKEQRWIDKHASRGVRQARGTVRALSRQPALLTNGRGRILEVEGSGLRWVAAVIIDHPDLPEGVVIEEEAHAVPSVVLARRDWEFLFDQLKSVHAVADYLRRVAGNADTLGEEAMRYYDYALADERATPAPLDPALTEGRTPVSQPVLPMVDVGAEDEQAHLFIRSLLEDVAISPGAGELPELRRLEVLAELDRLPVGMRGGLGRQLLEWLEEAKSAPSDGSLWRFRRLVGAPESPHLLFGVCSQFSPDHQDAFMAWVQLRHHERQQRTGQVEDLTTVGVLVTPRDDGVRLWDTTMIAVSGDLELTDEQLSAYKEVWSVLDDPSNPARTMAAR